MPPLPFWISLGAAWLACAGVTLAILHAATRTAVEDPTDTLAEAHPWDRDLANLIGESVD